MVYVEPFVGSTAELKQAIEAFASKPGVIPLQLQDVPNVPDMRVLIWTRG